MNSRVLCLVAVLVLRSAVMARPELGDPSLAVDAINSLGLKLLARVTPSSNSALLSPYSIQNALAMTYAGAAGKTRAEMAQVLDYASAGTHLDASFAALAAALDQVRQESEARASEARESGRAVDPITLVSANRLFGDQSFQFLPAFLATSRDAFGASLQPMDFIRQAEAARREINLWVSSETRDRIRDLIPAGALDASTRLVLVNAIYLKAPWQNPFMASRTQPEPFRVPGTDAVSVPTMQKVASFGYTSGEGFSVIGLPYSGGALQFLILLPDDPDGLESVASKLTAATLASGSRLPRQEIELHLPRFRLEPPVMNLGTPLRELGMTSAFDEPPGSADFTGMAEQSQGAGLRISGIFHKTFLELDEQGTEAAAATAVSIGITSLPAAKPKPRVVRVDRPFLFAIQHRDSGACLFLGKLRDPR
ncbi:MAG: serpin family protein [Verrucomicrobiae bacterium]|nr:serpin family protein [Verrucomicrobiae bacterium]